MSYPLVKLIKRAKVKIMPSKDKRAINRCFRWIERVSIALIVVKGISWINERGIATRETPNLRFTRPMLDFSFCGDQKTNIVIRS